MPPFEDRLTAPESHDHRVQFYDGDEQHLLRNVSNYLWEGLKRGDGLVVIASPEHREGFQRQLNLWGDADGAVEAGRLVFLDAQQTLDQFMIDGQPDCRQFEGTIEPILRQVRVQAGYGGLRAYGEMVGLLWKERRYSAAIRLEQFWNRLMISNQFQLFCAYPINIFGQEFEAGAMDAILCAHTHLLPAGENENLVASINAAMAEILGPKADSLRDLMKANHRPSWAAIPRAEAIILWLRNNLPERADEIIALARQYQQPKEQTAAFAN